MCLYPKLVKNRKYIPNKKNGGIVPPLPILRYRYKGETLKNEWGGIIKTYKGGEPIYDERVLLVPTGCGKCMECRKQKAREWKVRLSEEIRTNKNGVFVTLTFNNASIKKLSKGIKLKGYELDNEIATIAMRKFLERWRKKYKKSVRHWFVTELGHNGTENIHLHGIIWTDICYKEIDRIWGYGYTWIGDESKGGWVNEQTVNYIVKYVYKADEKHKEYKSIMLLSHGIGKGYMERLDAKLNVYSKDKTREYYKTREGYKVSLPIYYRNHLFTEEQKELLWIEKLNKEERYVNGQKISTKDGDELYYRALEEARKLNRELGYGDDEINWERKKYEQQRRMINHIKRTGTEEEIERLEKELIGRVLI